MAQTEPLRIIDIASGTRIRDWEVGEHIADGGSASVYRGSYVGIADRFPDKAVLRISGDLGPSRTRATIAAYNRAPTNPSVIQVFDLFEWLQGTSSHLVFVLEAAEYTLADRLERGTLSPEQGYELVKQIGVGLDGYHRAGLVHGDVKPSNIMWADGRWKLGDHAGAAPIERDGKTSAATLHEASLAYRPPESFDDPTKAHRHGDLWALAVVAHEAITGRQPFSGRRQQLMGPYDIDPKLGPELVDFVSEMLRLDPTSRPARQAGELSFVENEKVGRLGLTGRDRNARHKSLAGVLAGVGVLVVGGWWFFRAPTEAVAIPIAPVVVTPDSQPTFRWEAVPEASSYLVFVNQYGEDPQAGRISRRVSAVDAGCAESSECELRSQIRLSEAFEWWVTALFEDGSERVNDGAYVVIEPVATS